MTNGQVQALKQAVDDLALIAPESPAAAVILASVCFTIADGLKAQAAAQRTERRVSRQARKPRHKAR